MDHIELIEIRKTKLSELENLINTAKIEKRKLTEDENVVLEKVKTELQDLDKDIEEKRDTNNNNKQKIKIKETNKMENFSLLRSIRNIVEGRSQDDNILAYLEAGKNDFIKSGLTFRGQLTLPMESRASEVLAGTAIQGQEIVTEDKFSLLSYLRANSVLVASGAQLLGNLVGDVSIPYLGTGSTASWATEVADSQATQVGFGEKTMSPKRLTTYIDISKQFLIQDSLQAEQMLRNDLMASLTDKLEATLLGTASGSTTQPAGIFNGVSYTFSGATSWANLVSLETAVANANALKNDACYIFNPTTVGALKTTSKAGTEAIFLADGNSTNGYPIYSSTNLQKVGLGKACVFGVMSDLLIGQWGGLDLTVDMYSLAIYGKIRLVVNAYFDAVQRRSASFAYGCAI